MSDQAVADQLGIKSSTQVKQWGKKHWHTTYTERLVKASFPCLCLFPL